MLTNPSLKRAVKTEMSYNPKINDQMPEDTVQVRSEIQSIK